MWKKNQPVCTLYWIEYKPDLLLFYFFVWSILSSIWCNTSLTSSSQLHVSILVFPSRFDSVPFFSFMHNIHNPNIHNILRVTYDISSQLFYSKHFALLCVKIKQSEKQVFWPQDTLSLSLNLSKISLETSLLQHRPPHWLEPTWVSPCPAAIPTSARPSRRSSARWRELCLSLAVVSWLLTRLPRRWKWDLRAWRSLTLPRWGDGSEWDWLI